MLNGDGSENCKKSIGLISRKKTLTVQHTFLYTYLPLFARLQLITSRNFLVTYVSLFTFFFTAAHFILVAASISHLLTAAIKFSCFFSGRKEIRLLFKFFLYLWPLFFFCYPHQCRHRNLLEKKIGFVDAFSFLKIWVAMKFHLCLLEGINVRTFIRTKTKFSNPWCSAARAFARATALL